MGLPTSSALTLQTAHISGDVHPSVRILGSRVHLISVPKILDQMEHWITHPDGVCHRVVVTGFHGLWEAHRDPALKKMLNGAELWAPDGIAPVWVARLRGHRSIDRAPGFEILAAYLQKSCTAGYSSYFYGSTPDVLDALSAKITRDFPEHRLVGSFSPPFRPLTMEEDEEVIARINEAKPDVLWVGLGMPKQDIWIYEHLHRLKVPVAIGVGAAFSFLAGTVEKCPEWVGRSGFEWVYRFVKEPRKLWRRDLIHGPQFLLHVGLDLIGFYRDEQ